MAGVRFGQRTTLGLGNRYGSSSAGVEGKRCHANRGPGEKVGTSSGGKGPPVIC